MDYFPSTEPMIYRPDPIHHETEADIAEDLGSWTGFALVLCGVGVLVMWAVQ